MNNERENRLGGSRAVIGAGSVVTRDLPDGVFAAENSCRVLRELAD
jgi:maltose O-acetyltransferase